MSENPMNDDEFNQLYDRISNFYLNRNQQNVQDENPEEFIMPPDDILNHDIMLRLNEEQNEQIQMLIEGFNNQNGNMGMGGSKRRKSRHNKGKRRKTHRKKSRRSRGKGTKRNKKTKRR